MINGTEVDLIVNNFSQNAWAFFIEFWVIVLASLLPLAYAIWNQFKKPKITINPKVNDSIENSFTTVTSGKTNEERQCKSEKQKIEFWFHVKNIGKRTAQSCSASMKIITNYDEPPINFEIPYDDYIFPVKWTTTPTTSSDKLDLTPNNTAMIKIPILWKQNNVLVDEDKDPWCDGGFYFSDALETTKRHNLIGGTQRNPLTLYVSLFLVFGSKTIKKNFAIDIEVFKKDTIYTVANFTSVDTRSS